MKILSDIPWVSWVIPSDVRPTTTDIAWNHLGHLRLYHLIFSPWIVYPYRLDGSVISRYLVVPDLGALIESRLKFGAHVSKIVNDSFCLLGVISCITRNFHRYSCILYLFCSLVLWKFEFSSTVWNFIGLNQTHRWDWFATTACSSCLRSPYRTYTLLWLYVNLL